MAYGPDFLNYYNNFYNPIDFGGNSGVMAGIPDTARKEFFDFSQTPYTQLAAQWTDLFGKRQDNEGKQNQLDERRAFSQAYEQNPNLSLDDPVISQIYGKYGDISGLASIENRKRQAQDQQLQVLGAVQKIGEVDPNAAQMIYSKYGLDSEFGPLNTEHLGEVLTHTPRGGLALVNRQTGATRVLMQGEAKEPVGGGMAREVLVYNDKGEPKVLRAEGKDVVGQLILQKQLADQQGYTHDKYSESMAAIKAMGNPASNPAAPASPGSDPILKRAAEFLSSVVGAQEPNKVVRVKSKVK